MWIAIRGNKRGAESLAKNESTGRTGSCSGTLIIVTFSLIRLLCIEMLNHEQDLSVKGDGQDE